MSRQPSVSRRPGEASGSIDHFAETPTNRPTDTIVITIPAMTPLVICVFAWSVPLERAARRLRITAATRESVPNG